MSTHSFGNSLGNQEHSPLKHFPIAKPIEDLATALKGDEKFAQSLDRFYLNMLSELEPTKRKAAYIEEEAKEIDAIFRIQGSIVALMFKDQTLHCNDSKVCKLIQSINGPVSVGRISLLLNNAYQGRVSVDCFTAHKPTFKDYKKGILFNEADLEAGLEPDHTSIDEHMCEWLQLYQLWLEDYLYFNLAQISKEPGAILKERIQNLSPLHSYLHANA